MSAGWKDSPIWCVFSLDWEMSGGLFGNKNLPIPLKHKSH